MNQKLNFNKSDLSLVMAKKLKLSESFMAQCIEHITADIVMQVALDNKVEIRGFGVFSKKYIRPRKFINPKTKGISYLGETAGVHFKPSKYLILRNE
ncbi:HU family DNA-binding protein [Pseudomonadota bacterium]|jgi:nucleoid DNA-binding protein|nr:HU family DNA-binding protein [Pseudomonadota bacterium]